MKKLREIVIKIRFYEEECDIIEKINKFTRDFLDLNHMNLTRFFDCFKLSNETICFVIEFCDGDDFSTFLANSQNIILEKDAKNLLKQILYGLLYINEKKIIHGNLKPKNILFHKGDVKITDYWLFQENFDDKNQEKIDYLPPEFSKNYKELDFSFDVWTVGVLYYEMIFGEKPDVNSLKFPLKPAVSADCKDFIARCLTEDYEKRWTIKQALDGLYLSKF